MPALSQSRSQRAQGRITGRSRGAAAAAATDSAPMSSAQLAAERMEFARRVDELTSRFKDIGNRARGVRALANIDTNANQGAGQAGPSSVPFSHDGTRAFMPSFMDALSIPLGMR